MTSDDKDFTTFVERWMNSSPAAENITHVSIRKKYSGKFADLPNTLHPDLVHLLKSSGIDKLYEHQKNALAAIENGKNTLLTTGPSSGKSLTYIIPIINDLFSNRSTNALLIFPTKALAYDQFQHIQRLITSNAPGNNNFGKLMDKIAVYDGDTPKEARSSIRKKVKVLITNPDMLHIGILPNHSLWENYFESLKFIIVDEAHIYHGIFGSHVSNVIRRLKRVMLFYQTKPHFICTTATIGNPEEFIHALIEEEFLSISDDRSPQGERKFIFYNPPIIQKDLGIRASTRRETLNIADTFFRQKIQTLIFQRSRKEVEKSYKLFMEYHSDQMNSAVAAYRSGYLANDRRNLEERFQSEEIKTLFSTNALELGIDIGGLKCVMLSGYPGSISSTLQQIGRSGRKNTNSLAILIASPNPIDQFIINRPEYLLLKSPERALINPNNLQILRIHLRYALAEGVFQSGDNFGSLLWEAIVPLLDEFVSDGIATRNQDRYFKKPSSDREDYFSLRTSTGNSMKLINFSKPSRETIGEIDYSSSLWMTHPNSIYLHLGEQYKVLKMDFLNNEIHLEENHSDYFTEPKLEKHFEVLSTEKQKPYSSFSISLGRIKVTKKVIGYKEILWEGNQVISVNEIDMPEIMMETEAIWFYLPEEIKNDFIHEKLLFSERNQYGRNWEKIKDMVRERDNFTCQSCGNKEVEITHHVHHIQPYKLFDNEEEANHPNNLITLCPSCHHKAELQVMIRSGMTGLAYLLKNLTPVFILSDSEDIDVIVDSKKEITGFKNSIIIYDNIPYGLGLSTEVFKNFPMMITEMKKHVEKCGCHQGCPSCVGPAAEGGYGGKDETRYLLSKLLELTHEG